MKTVKLAIIGAGGMANQHARKFKEIKNCTVVAAADVDFAKAKKFAADHGLPQAYASADELLDRAEVDAVAVVVPDKFHAAVAIQCLKAGKHVLCEKPLAMNYAEAQKMVRAAAAARRVNMVNLSYRDWPVIQAVAKLARRGGVGEVRHVEASYAQGWLNGGAWREPGLLWRLSSRHGSQGVLGDLGVHIVDFATYPVGPVRRVFSRLKAFPKARGNRVGEYVLDANDSAFLNVEFANGALGSIYTSRWCGGHANRLYLKICGTKATVEIDSEVATDTYRIRRVKKHETWPKDPWVTVQCPPTPNNYQRFIKSIVSGGPQEQPDFKRGAEVQKVLDACFAADKSQRSVGV
ncbi:MAG: Gfo/Idh/MocA family oxidoreductase [Verrucomicrobiales bacterium]|jgi:predicted dehydrogenase|nr:Gfo/Idh/MocA family oxidoreductase [Verrucomicrobiales bacterium]